MATTSWPSKVGLDDLLLKRPERAIAKGGVEGILEGGHGVAWMSWDGGVCTFVEESYLVYRFFGGLRQGTRLTMHGQRSLEAGGWEFSEWLRRRQPFD